MSISKGSYPSKPEFSTRIVVCDHYLSKPTPGLDVIYSEFRGSDIKQVPILRIFGPTPDGHKACLHIHGVFPYFYIPCPTPNPEPQFLYQIAASLDKALNIALKQATSTNQHVYKITLVKGLPFYGFHYKDHLYLKVFLYSPGLIKHAVELFSNGAILGQTFQPHESHLNFTLQFFIDFNLFGMSNIDLQSVKFRKTKMQCSTEVLDSPEEFTLKAESSCYYEADCIASHIINRQRVGKSDGIENPGLEEVWNQEIQRRKQLNLSLASKSLSQGRMKADETESHYKFEQIFLMRMSNLNDMPIIVPTDINKVVEQEYYPAESLEESQLFNAVDVSIHLPDQVYAINLSETLKGEFNETLSGDMDETFVDESVALSCSLHHSQVLLNSEDLDLVDMLQDMDERPVETDSVMGTPANEDEDPEADDAEYSQIYDENTIILNDNSKDDENVDFSSWNESFWQEINIPQLDGTMDDDHVKKVRKRKMRPLRLGLSKPKVQKKEDEHSILDNTVSVVDVNDSDEINISREIIENSPEPQLKKSIKIEKLSFIEEDIRLNVSEQMLKLKKENEPVLDVVDTVTINPQIAIIGAVESYDLQNKFKPEAGPSNVKRDLNPVRFTQNNTQLFLDDSDLGIKSFYDVSKIFDESIENGTSFESISNQRDKNICDSIKDENETNDENIIHGDDQELCCNIVKIENDCTVDLKEANVVLTPKIKPPTKKYVISNFEQYNISRTINPKPYYSDSKDVGDKVEIGQMLLKLHSKSFKDQKPFDKVLNTASIEEWRQLLFLQTNEMGPEISKPDVLKSLLASNRKVILVPIVKPPTRKQVEDWILDSENFANLENKDLQCKDINKNCEETENSQALGLQEDEIDNSISLESTDKDKSDVNDSLQITMQPDGSFLCFGSGKQNEESISQTPTLDIDFLTTMLAEVHTAIRGELHPDPAVDPIQAVFLMVSNDCPSDHYLQRSLTEILVVDSLPSPKYLHRCVFNTKVTYVSNESEILEKVIAMVNQHDPDIMCGYEIEMNSWGYIIERAQNLGLEIIREMSRITEKNRQKRWRTEDKDFEGKIIGRVMFNVWRLFRHELALSSYSFENCMYEILKERVPSYSCSQLAEWWIDESRMFRWISVEYYLTRLLGTMRMLEKLDIINRTSELARLFGLQWWEVLSRGSQFRVESLMLRAARPLNLIALSPTVKQRATMRAPECLPLIFEPESRFYSDPVIVLDFQSLYPSMMIAYNYCFSTCIGRVQNINGDSSYEFGAWRLRIPKSKLETLVKNDLVHWSPVGVGFVKSSVRRGVLPALLRRILAARQAVKKSMKMQTDGAVKKAMHSRQLGLKLIANVTYGYTAANFSGRMPCVEVGDSVVSKGRETLERAIKLVRDNTQWNAKVVYGDTDSMFVLVPGGTRAEAFEIGQQIADAVTADNPSPVALKLEKVYQPCILQTKKRYVGFMYESADQETPIYEAKGIETVRRDGCPAGVKMLQESLCSLFSSGDMSLVKRGVVRWLSKLVDGSLPPQELIFTREYHGPGGYRPGATAPPNEIAKRIASRDRRAMPRTGWRISWLVTAGPPGAPLVKLARSPRELVKDPSLQPHVSYYAARVLLPPLHRCLSLLGVDVFKWWSELGYNRTVQQKELIHGGGIARYMSRERCAVCGERVIIRATSSLSLCGKCVRTQKAAASLTTRFAVATQHVEYCNLICGSCCGHSHAEKCENTECAVLWRRLSAHHKLFNMQELLTHLPENEQKYRDF